MLQQLFSGFSLHSHTERPARRACSAKLETHLPSQGIENKLSFGTRRRGFFSFFSFCFFLSRAAEWMETERLLNASVSFFLCHFVCNVPRKVFQFFFFSVFCFLQILEKCKRITVRKKKKIQSKNERTISGRTSYRLIFFWTRTIRHNELYWTYLRKKRKKGERMKKKKTHILFIIIFTTCRGRWFLSRVLTGVN